MGKATKGLICTYPPFPYRPPQKLTCNSLHPPQSHTALWPLEYYLYVRDLEEEHFKLSGLVFSLGSGVPGCHSSRHAGLRTGGNALVVVMGTPETTDVERLSHGSPAEVLAPQAPVSSSQWKAKLQVCM